MENSHSVCWGQKLVKNGDFLDDKFIRKLSSCAQERVTCWRHTMELHAVQWPAVEQTVCCKGGGNT
jgi:hypothetical protein